MRRSTTTRKSGQPGAATLEVFHSSDLMLNSSVTLVRSGDVCVLVIDNPPVNALSAAVVQGLIESLDAFERDPRYVALVMHCAGRTFIAGGDIAEFEDPAFSAAPLNRWLARLEAQSRPVVAALHGTALGGGLEVAMACHWRVAAAGTRVAMPEVKLGLLPGSLGTQRLPRLAGAPRALAILSSGDMVPLDEALADGIIDEVAQGAVLDAAIARARQLAELDVPLRCASALQVDRSSLPPGFIEQARERAQRQPHYPALAAVVEAVEAAIDRPFAEGARVEAEGFERCLRSPESKALRHLFFAARRASKIPGMPAGIPVRSIRRVGVLGAGTMGRGIAMAFANAGLPVVLAEASADALEHGVATLRASYEASAAKGRLTPDEAQARVARIQASLDDTALSDCDLVVEAVYEDMALKERVAARLGQICRPGAIIATNTSTLDVDRIAAASGQPANVIGMHFFSPAQVMRLLEVVRGAATAPDVLATAMQLASRIGKVAVVSGVCYGFIGNRMAEVYMREAEFLLLEGASPADVDAAVEGLGFAMGPCRMLDMAGIDVGAKTLIERRKTGGLPSDPSYRAVVQRLYALGWYGQKSGRGYYRYEGRQALPDEEVIALCAELGQRYGIKHRAMIPQQEIVERLLFPMMNEGAKILEEGIAYRASDIDVVWTAGYGFPDHRGGPMHLADVWGLERVVGRIERRAAIDGDVHGYWEVSPFLRRLAQQGGSLAGAVSPRWLT